VHRTIRNLLLVAVVLGAATATIGLDPNSARAYHTYEERLLDNTAYSLHRRRARLGLMKLSYGVIDQLQVTTYTMPYVLGTLFEDIAPNLELKSTVYDQRRLALSGSLGFVTGRIEQIDSTKIRYLTFPISLAASVRINSRVNTHLGGQYTATKIVGGSEPSDTDIEGAAVVDLLQLWGMVEWRLSKVTAFTFTVRWVPYVSDTVVRGNLVVDPGNPTIGIGLEIELLDLTHAYSLVPGFVFSWERANIRLGAGYGSFPIDGVGLVVPGSVLNYVSPEFDIFVRF